MAVPAGVIVGWPGTEGSIPAGWSRVTALDGRYPKGVPDSSTEPGSQGGAASHSHTTLGHDHNMTHNHSMPANTGTPTGATISLQGGSAGISGYPSNHTHQWGGLGGNTFIESGVEAPGTSSELNDPPNLSLIWIESDGSPEGVPDQAVALFDEPVLPNSWSLYVDSTDRFLCGASGASGGAVGAGNLNHNHTLDSHSHAGVAHDHSSGDVEGLDASVNVNFSGNVPVLFTATHDHFPNIRVDAQSTGTLGVTSDVPTDAVEAFEPPFYTLGVIRNLAGVDSLPIGTVALWMGSLVSIPAGWFLCDGTNGTPTLNGQYVKGAGDTSDIGVIGGGEFPTHVHGGSNHTHTIGSHNHSTDISEGGGTLTRSSGGVTQNARSHRHSSANTSSESSFVDPTFSQDSGAAPTEPEHTEVVFIQFQGVVLAPEEEIVEEEVDFEFPLDVLVEAAFGADPQTNSLEWTWTGLSGRVKSIDGIRQVSGRGDEQSQWTAAQADLAMDNDDGDLTPDSPRSPYYPNIVVGTPVRVMPLLEKRTEVLRDNFDRVLNGSWGVPNLGHRWIDSALSNDFQMSVSAGKGRITFGDDPNAVITQEGVFFNGVIEATVGTAQTSTDDDITVSLGWRSLGFYMVELAFQPDGNVTLGLYRELGTVLFDTVVDAFAYEPDQPFNVEIVVKDDLHEITVWPEEQVRPFQPTFVFVDTGRSDLLPTQGGFLPGVIFILGTNTSSNVDPEIWVDQIVAKTDPSPIIFGTLSEVDLEWPQGDLSIDDPESGVVDEGYSRVRWVVAGPLRRLLQGSQPFESPLFRQVTGRGTGAVQGTVGGTDVIYYWPLEEGSGASAWSQVIGTEDLIPVPVQTGMLPGNFTNVPAGTLPLPRSEPGTPGWNAEADRESIDAYRLDFLFAFANSEDQGVAPASNRALMNIYSFGTTYDYRIIIDPSLNLILEKHSGTDESDSVSFPALDSLVGEILRVTLILERNPGAPGVDYDLRVETTDETPQVVAEMSGTFAAGASDFLATPGSLGLHNLASGNWTERVWGHLTISASAEDPWADAAIGFAGEQAHSRFARLAVEESLPFVVVGAGYGSGFMGPQKLGAITELFSDIEGMGGFLFELRNVIGIGYRTMGSLLSQASRIELSANPEDSDIFVPFLPVLDDKDVVNIIAVNREGGGDFTLSDDDDVNRRGPYPSQVTVPAFNDGQLQDIAAWILHLGTWPGMRYRQITPALGGKPELIPVWHELIEGDRIVIRDLPPQHPNKDVDVLLRGRALSAHPLDWRETDNTIQGEPRQLGLLGGNGQSESADIGNRYDTSGSMLVEPISKDDTEVRIFMPPQGNKFANGDFERANMSMWTDVGGFSSDIQDASISRDTARWLFGTASGRVDPEPPAVDSMYVLSSRDNAEAQRNMQLGAQSLQFSAWLYAEQSMRVQFVVSPSQWNQPLVTTTRSPFFTLPAGQWTLVTKTVPVPLFYFFANEPNRMRFMLGVRFADDAEAGSVWIDGIGVGGPAQPWVNTLDHPDEFPFEIDIGGEIMTVTGAERAITDAPFGMALWTNTPNFDAVTAPMTVLRDGLMIGVFISQGTSGTWTVVGTMTKVEETNGTNSDMATATEAVSGFGDIGPRTATHSVVVSATNLNSTEMIVFGEDGPPTLEEVVSNLTSGTDVTVITSAAQVGWWMVAVWGVEVEDNSPNEPGIYNVRSLELWERINFGQQSDSPNEGGVTLWIKQVTEPGPQTVTFPFLTGTGVDNHLHVLVFSGVAPEPGLQTLKVERGEDARAHDIVTPVSLANPLRFGPRTREVSP